MTGGGGGGGGGELYPPRTSGCNCFHIGKINTEFEKMRRSCMYSPHSPLRSD